LIDLYVPPLDTLFGTISFYISRTLVKLSRLHRAKCRLTETPVSD